MTRSRDVSAVQNNLGVAIPPAAAGKNAVINGGMDIWQRGTSFTVTGTGTGYTADRWLAYRGAAGSTISRQATNDTTNLPNIQYCMRVQRDSGNTSTNQIILVQNFETVNSIPFAGKTVTLSFYARAGANYSATSNALPAYVYTGTGTDQNLITGYTGSAASLSGTATLTTTWQRFSFTATMPTNITELALDFPHNPTGTAGAADYFEITGVQLELGNTATPFSRAGGNIQGELAACQRYYVRMGANSGGTAETYSNYGSGYSVDASNITAFAALPVQMRVRPTAIEYANLAIQDFAAAVIAVSALTLNTSQSSFTVGTVNGTVSGSTAARGCKLVNNNNNAGYLAFSAEL